MLRKIIDLIFPYSRKIRQIMINQDFLNKLTSKYFDLELNKIINDRQLQHPNPLAKFGKKCFSQTDEDGITMEILRRLKISTGCFAEFGVGDGTENNTLVLASLGWKGFWVGGEDLAFNTQKSEKLHYQKEWVTKENILQLFNNGLNNFGRETVDLVSLDLDGNDLYFCEELLANGVTPPVFIVEYNAKFPPPIRFTIDYDPAHIWDGSDYHGASLVSINDLFERYDYSLVCCNAASGANAFFVRNEHLELFPDVPKNIDQIYTPPHFFLFRNFGHPPSGKTIERIINN